MAGGGSYRTDQVKFAIARELVDGEAPAIIALNPGIIKGGITLPDTEYEWDMFYGVGRDGRSRKNAHKGNQSFSGAIPQIYFQFNESRDIMALIIGELSEDAVYDEVAAATITYADATLVDSTQNFTTGTDVKTGDYAVFSGITIGYIGTDVGGGVTEVTVYPTPARTAPTGWNGPLPVSGVSGDGYEIRKTESVVLTTGNKFAVGTQHLNTMSWAVQHRNSSNHGSTSVGSNLTINYLGGKTNRATLSARQGEKLMLALDEVIFRDLRHDSALPSTSVAKYDAGTVTPTAVHPTEEPLVFSQGTISLFELSNTFAKIRDFSLAINNNITEERYVSTVEVNGATVINQIPNELLEGNREITLEITAVMETREYWEHLMREGQNDALTGKTGFDFLLKFQANSTGTENFYIQGPAHAKPVIISDASLPINTTNAQSTTANVGCVITAAPHEVPGEGEPLIAVTLSIDVPSLVMWWDDL